ncbi:MAG TPA: DUF5995 family protein [Kofleriaceae bacterium]|jgi:hypothetical protein|nr:DUF5995 family protein [Kofleriaceae bacterium]
MSGGFPDGTTLGAVVETMAGRRFDDDDGVRYFHMIYTEVTRAVARREAAGGFEDPAFLVALDVEFAGLYLEALDAPDTAPRAWRVLFTRRRQKLAPLQFALAGMNAHINRDLAVALDTTCTTIGGALVRDSPRCRDFAAINDLLTAQTAKAKAEVFSRVERIADAALGSLDDRLEAWSITAARDNAWSHGTALHQLGVGEAKDAALQAIDRTASLIGQLLLL